MTSLTFHGRTYTCEDRGEFGMTVTAPGGCKLILTRSKASDEAAAVRWLSSMSLRKGKARALVAAEMQHTADKNAIVTA